MQDGVQLGQSSDMVLGNLAAGCSDDLLFKPVIEEESGHEAIWHQAAPSGQATESLLAPGQGMTLDASADSLEVIIVHLAFLA